MQALPALHQILGSIPWVLVGGIALRAYIPERMTLDVYILVHQRDEERVRAAFLAAGYRVTGLLSIGGLSVQSVQASEPPIDVLTRADVWLDDALAELVHDSAGYPVLGRSFLILLKLQAGRTQDLADVQRLVAHTSAEERTAYLQLIRRESPELIEDLESLYTLADLEFGNRAQEG